MTRFALCSMLVATVFISCVGRSFALTPGILYLEDFDADTTANWINNPGNPPAMPTDALADFFFDYSAVGIPPAPNSAGATTRGMKLQANLYSGIFGGFSVSPVGQSFTGNYSLTFDWWANYIGSESTGVDVGAAGSSMLSTFGIETSGTLSNSPGIVDGLWFAATGDGQSAADYRAYAPERVVSYQIPPGAPEDGHAFHFAGSRNNSAPLYASSFGGAVVPAAQTALFPETQFGSTPLGAPGFAWHRVEILKYDSSVVWLVDNVALILVEMAEFSVPTGGTNIMFGHSDVNAGISFHPNFDDVQFTLIDNIMVTVVPEPPGLAMLAMILGGAMRHGRRHAVALARGNCA
jgi:hypothetical protein